MEWMKEAAKSATDISGQMRLPTVLSSLLWTLPWLVGALVIAGFSHNQGIVKFLIMIISIVLGVALLAYVGILLLAIFWDRTLVHLLRSEDHAFNMALLSKIGDEKKIYTTYTEAAEVPGRTNPNEKDPEKFKVPEPNEIPSQLPRSRAARHVAVNPAYRRESAGPGNVWCTVCLVF